MFVSRQSCPLCANLSAQCIHEEAFNSPAMQGFLAEQFPGLDQEKLCDFKYMVLQCPQCSFTWERDVLEKDVARQMYENWLDKDVSYAKFASPTWEHLGASMGTFLIAMELLKKNRPAEIVAFEHGMGWGRWSKMAVALGMQVYGSDLSPSRMQDGLLSGVCVVDSIQDIPKKVDLIYSNQVLEHVPDPVAEIKSFAAQCVSGGIVILSVPDSSKDINAMINGTYVPHKGALHPLEHINGFVFDSLLNLMSQYGFVFIEANDLWSIKFGDSSLTLEKNGHANFPLIFRRNKDT